MLKKLFQRKKNKNKKIIVNDPGDENISQHQVSPPAPLIALHPSALRDPNNSSYKGAQRRVSFKGGSLADPVQVEPQALVRKCSTSSREDYVTDAATSYFHNPMDNQRMTERLIMLHSEAKRESIRSLSISSEYSEYSVDNDDPTFCMMGSLKNSSYSENRNPVFARRLDMHSVSISKPVDPKSHETVEFLDNVLRKHFVIGDMSARIRQKMIEYLRAYSFEAGVNIIEQGEDGDYMYIVDSGEIAFDVDGKNTGGCTRGAVFGDLAVLYTCLRGATCTAVTNVRVWKLHQTAFRFIVATETKKEEEELNNVLRSIPFLAALPENTLKTVLQSFTRAKFAAGNVIVSRGEEGQVFYVVKSGEAIVEDIEGTDGDRTVSIGPGHWFGERALFLKEPRSATVRAKTDIIMLCLSRGVFEAVLGAILPLIRLLMADKHDSSMHLAAEIFDFLESSDVDYLEESYNQGHVLVERSSPIKRALYFICDGSIELQYDNKKTTILKAGDYFGEESMLGNDDAATEYTATVVEDGTEVSILDAKGFYQLVSDVSVLDMSRESVRVKFNNSIHLQHLEKLRILGTGTFGKVWLVSEKITRTAYALKSMDKRMLLENQQIEYIFNEKDIMQSLNHPFIIRLVNTFQDDKCIYMLMGLVQGGELFSIIKKTRGLPNDQAKFYSACIVEALRHMHMLHICYRDLKPENILIDADGYCVIVDMGFAKIVTDQTYTLCGTPAYLAPEVIMAVGHNVSADCWSLGCLIYEMFIGRSPFFTKSRDQIRLFRKILDLAYKFPKIMDETKQSGEVKFMIKGLLVREPGLRFPMYSTIDNNRVIRSTDWFKNFDWDGLYNRRLIAPWRPVIKDQYDSSNFDDYSKVENQDNDDDQDGPLPELTRVEQKQFAMFDMNF